MELGERLLELRVKNQFSLNALAEKLGTSERLIRKWESGKRLPNCRYIEKMAEIYQMEIEEILQPVGMQDSIEQNKSVIAAILISIMLLLACTIPVAGIIIPVIVFIKYREKRYSFLVKLLAVICFCISVYSQYMIIEVHTNQDEGIGTIEKISEGYIENYGIGRKITYT